MEILTSQRRLRDRACGGGLAALLAVLLALPASALESPSAPNAHSAPEVHSEAAIEAAYLYRFARYVEWPRGPAAGRAFVIGVMGAPEVARELRRLVPGHPINNQTVQVREVTRVREVAGAQILYVGAHNDDFLRALRAGGVSSTLLVTDEEDGLDLGAALNFVVVDNRVRFEVSLTAAERAQLKISSDLLSVAVRVRGGRRQTGAGCIPFPPSEDADVPSCGTRNARLRAELPTHRAAT